MYTYYHVFFYSTVTEEEEEEAVGGKEKENEGGDIYNFDHYDDEDTQQDVLLGIGNLAVYSSNSGDPYVTIGDDEDDSEKEDDVISAKDNLILVGHVEGDASILEVYGNYEILLLCTIFSRF